MEPVDAASRASATLAASAVDLFIETVQIAVHQILFARRVYPRSVFERRRLHNSVSSELPLPQNPPLPPPAAAACRLSVCRPASMLKSAHVHTTPSHHSPIPSTTRFCAAKITVRMSRHPELNQYISTVMANARPLLLEGTVERVVCCIYDGARRPYERYEFRIRSLGGGGGGLGDAVDEEDLLSRTGDELRDLLLRTAALEWQLEPPSEGSGSTFALLVHCRPHSEGARELAATVGHGSAATQALRGGQWLLAEDREHRWAGSGAAAGEVEKTTAIRSVDSAGLQFQLCMVGC